jgi:hypothetical protein
MQLRITNATEAFTQRCMSQRCEWPDAVDLRRGQNWKNLSVSGKRTVHEIRTIVDHSIRQRTVLGDSPRESAAVFPTLSESSCRT